jgi:glycosyltransferase involved in cell wall biosynthesis
MSADISILICTRNRAERLRETLWAIARAGVPDERCELIVVDNGSTDNTAGVFYDVFADHPRARYVLESRAGHDKAYNRGVAESVGAVILCTDDDVVVPPDWAAGMAQPIFNGNADAIQGGVRIPPALLRPWMQPLHRGWLASTETLDPNAPEGLVGANFAVGRHVFDRIPLFDEELGPGALGFAGESLFSSQMKCAGFRIGGRLDLTVEHHFDPSRLTPWAWIERAKRQGRSEAYLAYHWAHEEIVLESTRAFKHAAFRGLMQAGRLIFNHIPRTRELLSISLESYNQEIVRIRCSPRNYHKRGLVKIRGAGSVEVSRGRGCE